MYIVYQRLNIAGCRASGFLSTTAALAEVWSLAAVSLDRLLSIYYPLDKRKRITKSQVVSGKTMHRNVLYIRGNNYLDFSRKTTSFNFLQANAWIILTWVLSLAFATFPLLGWNKYVSEVNGISLFIKNGNKIYNEFNLSLSNIHLIIF